MHRKAAKELLHIKGWLERVDEIIDRGKDAYLADDILQEAGDSLMMKLGEAANRLSKFDVLAPDGVEWALAVANRNFLIQAVEARLGDAQLRSAFEGFTLELDQRRRFTRVVRVCIDRVRVPAPRKRPRGLNALDRHLPGACSQDE
jgi:hypothetical protein